MKTIAIDITHYDKLSGFGVLTRNIVKGLLETDKENKYILVSNKLVDFSELSITPIHIQSDKSFFRYKFFELANILKQNKVDIFLSIDPTLPIKKVCKYVMMEHDIGHQRLGRRKLIEWIIRGIAKISVAMYYILDLEKIHIRNADIIITSSEFSKKDILNHYHLGAKTIKIVHWGMDHLYNTKDYEKEDYILMPYCNEFDGGFLPSLSEKIIENGLASKVIFLKGNYITTGKNIINIQGKISNTDNERYYKQAKLTIYYSGNDGFGMVPLESMFYKTPVLINISSSLQEISGEGAVTINSDTTDEWLSKIKELLGDKEKYNNQIESGVLQVNKYKWSNTIDSLIKILLS